MAQVIVTPKQLALKVAYEAEVPVQHYVNSSSYINIFINRRDKREKLINADNTPTVNGKYYYEILMGVPVPDLFNIHEGIINGNLRIGGVDHRIIGNKGQVLKKGQMYYKQVKQEYIVNIPFKNFFRGYKMTDPRGDNTNSWYLPLRIPPITIDHATRNDTGTFL
jgi:hypothetical protein